MQILRISQLNDCFIGWLGQLRRCLLNTFECQACNNSSVLFWKACSRFCCECPCHKLRVRQLWLWIGINIYDSSVLRTSATEKVKEHCDFVKIVFKSYSLTCSFVRKLKFRVYILCVILNLVVESPHSSGENIWWSPIRHRVLGIWHVKQCTCSVLSTTFQLRFILIIINLIRVHLEIHLIMNIKRIKLRRFEVILTPLSSRGVSCSFESYHLYLIMESRWLRNVVVLLFS